MLVSPLSPKPVPVRAYRYSKWRWRVLVRLLDGLGALFMFVWRRARPRTRPQPNPGPPRSILLVQLDHLGDAVLTSPLVRRLRASFPEARIDVLASLSNRAVFEADPHIDRVHVAARNWFERRRGGFSLWPAVWALGRALRHERYDLGIDVRGDVLTIFVLALARVPRRVGWAMGGGGFLLTDIVPWSPGRHEVISRLALADALGLAADGPPRVAIAISDDNRRAVRRLLREARSTPRGSHAPLLAVHLGAGTAAKRWPIAFWHALIARFLTEGWRVVTVGGPEDLEDAPGLPSHPRLTDFTGQLSITETAALFERADLFLGADSGPAHVAACVGLPAVVLFSGTNLARQWRPWSRRVLVLRHAVPCGPCHLKACPLVDHPCMTGLKPDAVFRAARRWWLRLERTEGHHVRP